MAMISISYDKELREAFAAGEAAALSRSLRRKGLEGFTAPETYEAWIESIRDRPQIARG